MAELLKKLWRELNRPRALEINWITFEDEDLHSDLRNQINHYQEKNRAYALDKLFNWVVADTLYNKGFLCSEKFAKKEALRLFNEAKNQGRLDFLNSVGGQNERV